MKTTFDVLEKIIAEKESGNLEFKEARNSYSFETLLEYCCAIANEGGGRLLLGITDRRPRRVVGTHAFQNLDGLRHDILQALKLRVDCEEVQHPKGRVIIFHVPSRPFGMAVHRSGRYLMRSGSSIVPMSPDRLRAIHDEIDPDFSALVCKGATVSDLDEKAIDRLRRMWMKRSGNSALANISTEQLLRDCDLMHGKSLSNAAVILLGSNEAIRNYVSQAEVVYEYRATENSIDYQLRREFKAGFLLILDGLWNEVNKRNYVQTYREGLFAYEIPTFNEVAVREAILNAVSHRDYRLGGSVFLRQFPTRLEIISPGGLPSGITTENILDRQAPRNRKIAELLSKCGLVERSGQGMNRIVENAIRESKRRPDFNGTDDYQVSLTLSGEVQDTNFLRFLEKVGEDRLSSFTTQDFLAVDLLHKDERIPEALKPRVRALMEEGIVERVGSGRGVRYMLSGRF